MQDQLAEQFAALGIVPDAPVDVRAAGADVFHLWPDNVPAWEFFRRGCLTQWRHGGGGATGLDYPAVEFLMERHPRWRVSRVRRSRLWDLVRAMELGALQGWGERRAADEAKPRGR